LVIANYQSIHARTDTLVRLFAADSMCLLSFKCLPWPLKTHLWYNRFHISRWRSSTVDDFATDWKHTELLPISWSS